MTTAGRKALLKGQAIVGKELTSMLGQLTKADRNQLFKLFSALK